MDEAGAVRRGVDRVGATALAGGVRPDVVLVCSWAALSLGAAWGDGTYAPVAILLVTAGTVFLGAVVARRDGMSGGLSRAAMVTGAVAVLGALQRVGGIYAKGPDAIASGALLSAAAAVVCAALLLGPARVRAAALGATLAVARGALAGGLLIAASPRPAIDVWTMLQAAGHGLSHGHNPYTLRWTTGISYEQSNGFAYLPGSAVALWPFQALFGDVRVGLLVALVVTSLVLVRVAWRSAAAAVGCLALVYPKATFSVEQSWVDPLVLVTLCLAVFAVVRGRRGWAIVALACCLTCKQQAWLVLPVAAAWKDFGWRRAALSAGGALAFIAPWAVTAPRAFYHGAIAYNLDVPARLDSLSLYRTAIAHGFNPGFALTALVTLLAIGVASTRMRQSSSGFLLGAAFVMATFNLVNKQSFFNEWALVAGLLAAALAFGSSPAPDGDTLAHARLSVASRTGSAGV